MSDSENFNRVVRLLAGGGTLGLRRLLEKYSAPVSFFDFIYQNQGKVLQMKFFDNQRSLVISRDIDKMDITLLGKLAFDLFKDKLSPKERICINSIKDERDNLMHSETLNTAKIPSTVFDGKWQDISTVLLDLADEIGDPAFKGDLQDFIQETKNSNPDIREIHKILVEWCKSSKELENKIDSMATSVAKLTAKQEESEKKVTTRLDTLKDKFQSHYEYSNRVAIPVDRTMKKALYYLIDNHSVLIYGRPGEGKTTSAFRIVKSLVDEKHVCLNKCAMLFGPEDLNEIVTTDVDILFIDDMFGKHNAEDSKFAGWSNFFETLQAFVGNRKIKILMTSRMHIFLEYKSKLMGFDVFSRAVELSSTDLSKNEKEEILLAQLKAHGRDVASINVSECVSIQSQHESWIGFPLSAHYFAAEETLLSQKEDYFSKPYTQCFELNVRNLDENSLIALLYVFYKENKLKVTDLDITKMDNSSEKLLLHISKLIGVEKSVAAIIRGTKQKVNHFKNSYLKCINKSFSFLHDTMYETVALFHGKEYPSEVIKHCTVDFLCQCIRLQNETSGGILHIEEDDYPALAERCIEEVIRHKNGQRLSNHSMFTNYEFVEELLGAVTESDETFHDFLNTGLSFMYVGNHGFLYHIIAQENQADILFKQVLPALRCEHSSGKADSCWKCSVKSEATAGACSANKPTIYADLKSAGAEIRTVCLYKAVENRNIDPGFVKTIIDDLKLAKKFIPDDQILQYCLGLAVQHDTRSVFNILKDSGLNPANFDLLYYIVKAGDEYLLSSVLKDLVSQNKWISDYMTVSRALTEAIVTGKERLQDILVSSGAKLTEFAVYWAIVDHGYDSMAKIIRVLKDNDTFDVESYDLAHAMAIALKHLKKDRRIYNLLNQEGVIFTPTMVGAVCELGLPSADIKDIIKTLKQEGRWVGDAEERHMATAYMAAHKRADKVLIEVLSEEGAEMSPGCLRYAVVRHVDKVDHVIKYLKDSGKLNPHNKEIARAFVWSIEYTDKTMFNKLANAGLFLTMACLVPAVEYFYCSSTLDYIVSGLKTEQKWDPDHDFALEALNLANKRQDKSAYDKIVAEGIKWKEKNLYVAMMFETVYGLRCVLRQLKEHKLLDKSNNEILAAVSLAMKMKDGRKYQLLKSYGLGL